jgi:hypothetical protein
MSYLSHWSFLHIRRVYYSCGGAQVLPLGQCALGAAGTVNHQLLRASIPRQRFGDSHRHVPEFVLRILTWFPANSYLYPSRRYPGPPSGRCRANSHEPFTDYGGETPVTPRILDRPIGIASTYVFPGYPVSSDDVSPRRSSTPKDLLILRALP